MTKTPANDDDAKGRLDALTKEHDTLGKAHEKLTAERDDLAAKLDEAVAAQKNAVAERDELAKRLDTASAEGQRAADANAGIQRDRDALADTVKDLKAKLEAETKAHGETRGKLTEAKASAKLSRGPKSATARKVGPMAASDDDAAGDAAALLEELRSGPHSIVLSDGEREILSVEPINVTAEAFQPLPSGLVMVEPVRVRPDRAIVIRGYGLLNAAGKQIGWAEPVTPIHVAANQEVELKREFVF